jgi:predicted ATPase
MRLKTLYVRFFRSFNFDYLRKSRENARPDPWDRLGAEDDRFFPFVRIGLERDVTTIVGANEAGKSQLLGAIEAVLTGTGFDKKDFCRYSTEFREDGGPEQPEFGGQFADLTDEEQEALGALRDWHESDLSSFHFFRFHDRNEVFVGEESVEVDELPDGLTLPRSFRIDAEVALPDSIEISYLAGGTTTKIRTRNSWLSRIDFVRRFPESLENLVGGTRPVYDGGDESVSEEVLRQWELARRLLMDVAGITREEFSELSTAVRTSEGYAEALVDKMNRKLADSLNFRRWWSQDTDFALRLQLRDFDLVFTIHDRTGSDYTFKERSQGLKYFLSYFVQYLSHDPDESELLLMDEPDAFLSNSGQQDLLRIFDAFAHPEDEDKAPVQVIYVTHSPFLIDKNHAERIRVLEKGDGEEGTRLVQNAGRNHYEPLRTALGSFVAETTFISSCNLMLEGQADPVLLAGASAVARKIAPNGNALDLNTITLVACGGAGNVPYMVHLARGRDEDKPAVLVMVDNDDEGLKAVEDIRAIKGLLPADLLFTVADTVDGTERPGITELEDLIPAELANQAVKSLAMAVLPRDQAEAVIGAWKDVKPTSGKKLFKLLEAAASTASKAAGLERALEINKVPFARSVVDLALAPTASEELQLELYGAFQPILALIEQKQREAVRENGHERISAILKRLRRNFVADHPHAIRKNQASMLLETIQAQLPREAVEADAVLDGIRSIQRDFQLSDEPRSTVDDPDRFRERLNSLVYGVTNSVQVGV